MKHIFPCFVTFPIPGKFSLCWLGNKYFTEYWILDTSVLGIC